MFLSCGKGYVGESVELPQGCQGHFRGSREKVGYLSTSRSRKGPHLALRGKSGSTRVVARNVGFLSSYDDDLQDTLMWPQENPVYMRVARGLSGFFCNRFLVLGPHQELRLHLSFLLQC